MLRIIKSLFSRNRYSQNQSWTSDFFSDYFPPSILTAGKGKEPTSIIQKPSKPQRKSTLSSPAIFKRLINLYPPYLGAGVKVTYIKEDWRQVEVRLQMRWYNRNAFGTHFGGSIYSMVDPHLALMLTNLLGRDYIVWDKSAHIEFVKATKKPIHCVLTISQDELDDIIKHTENGEKYHPEFKLEILGEDEQLIAKVYKELYVRKKRQS
ncbi:DUF4442 domain-containing protein [Photobacterium sp. OFAV2-7]|uniref:DUF4442 domain-containing protein n=1 Tax=Photobacterium sp. OFAV2-7 TaxID=2917748 RepID=UPI001EF457E6|nr:DUF4442 domain-containing protein [Photobacterium sp. OFAV2-7]MCG7585193.1 DUF4442 domain-containing protein [Photobacterium sp. OFAV2-7]